MGFFSKHKGVSLVEILVSIVILSVGVIGSIAHLPHGYRLITKAGRISTMTHLASEKIEELQVLASTDWDNTSLNSGSYPASAPSRMVGAEFPHYSLTWTIVDNSPLADMKTIVVEAGYMVYDSNGVVYSPVNPEAMTRRFQTFLAK